MPKRISLSLAIGAILTCGLCAAQQTSYPDGQAVEVREGDAWSAATIVKKEGRKYSVRYKDSADDEWVTADRLRVPAGNAAPGTPAAPAAPGAPAAAKTKIPWALAQSVEVKRGAAWRTATVFKIDNGWVLVLYDPGNFREWVEPWRIREPGSKEDSIGVAPMHKQVDGEEPAPKDLPADNRATAPAGARTGVPSNWRDPSPGDRVQVYTPFGPKFGRMLQRTPEKIVVAVDGSRRGGGNESFDPLDVRIVGMKVEAVVGQRVQVREGGGWESATVVAREGERAKIKRDGWEDEMFHKWIALDELRPAATSDVPPIAGAAPNALRSLPGYRDADMSSAEHLSLIVANPGAKLAPDVCVRPTSRPSVRAVPVRGATGENTPDAIMSPLGNSPMVVVASHIERKDGIRVDRIDLDTGTALRTVDLAIPKDMRLAGVSPDASHAVFRKTGMTAGDRVEVWSIDPAAPKRELLLSPYPTGNPFEKDVRFAALLANDRLLLVGGKNELSVWDIKTGKAVYHCGANRDSRPGISANGRYIVFTTGKEAMIIETATGNAVMELPQPLMGAAAFAFSPSGRQLVACDAHTIWSVNLDTGELYRDFTLPGNITNSSIDAPTDGYALINNSILVDLERRCPIWKYEVPDKSAAAVLSSGQYAFAVDGDSRSTCNLISTTIPHPAALKAAQGLKGNELLLKPGVSVSLQTNVSCTEQERAAIMTYIASQMKDRGITIAPGQPIELSLSVEQGKTEQREYGSGPSFGPFARTGEKVTITQKISRMRITYQGKTVWEVHAFSGDPGFMLMRKQNQTMQQAVDEMGKPNLGVFTATRLPSYLVMPSNPMYLGASELTGRGLRDKKAEPEPDAPGTPPGALPPTKINGPVAVAPRPTLPADPG